MPITMLELSETIRQFLKNSFGCEGIDNPALLKCIRKISNPYTKYSATNGEPISTNIKVIMVDVDYYYVIHIHKCPIHGKVQK